MTILIAAGGSGGHLFPAQAMASQLQSPVIIAGHNLSKSQFLQKNYPFHDIAASPPKNIFRFIFSTLLGLFQSFHLFSKNKIDVVVGFGSFHTFPLLLAATILRKKIILFEANCSLGKVNRLFAPFAHKIAIQFPIKQKNGKTVFVPLLPWKMPAKQVSKEEALAYFGLPSRFTILIFGGSQGASFFNEIVLPDIQVIHFTGKGKWEKRENGCVKEFEERMDLAYTAADIVICRSGASTVAELIRYAKPALLIPFPFSSEDHQRENAHFFVKLGGGRLLDQKDATSQKIREEIEILRKGISNYEAALRGWDVGERVDLVSVIK